jgi:hypothetical protein
MDLFLDTCVIFGWCYNDDDFNPICSDFIKQYPNAGNNYYTTRYITDKEINELKNSRLHGRTRLIRLLENRAKILVPRITDIQYSTHVFFKNISSHIEALLLAKRTDNKRKDHDAILLTNAHIWDHMNQQLTTPHFVTLDANDIVKNRTDIQTIVTNQTQNNPPRLKIELVHSMLT